MKKIMFSDKYGLTEAVLEGRKTQTRRIIKCPRTFKGEWVAGFNIHRRHSDKKIVDWPCMYDADEREFDMGEILPKYKVGEVLAIAQRYKDIVEKRDEAQEVLDLYKIGEKYLTMEEMGAGWSNKMFVAADLMPHRIRITNVRVERLQDISDEDCLREGIEERRVPYLKELEYGIYNGNKPILLKPTPRDAYAALIDKISGKGIFQSNPFVFVHEFELID